MDIKSIYEDVADVIDLNQNGSLSFGRFNRFSKRAELKFIDWLTGKIDIPNLPQPYQSQKNKDWVSPFIVPLPANIVDGTIVVPPDYYLYEHLRRIGSKLDADCEEDENDNGIVTKKCDPIITMLDSAAFDMRCNTYIDELRPSPNNAIAKRVGNKIEFRPSDLGSIVLEYIRYPLYGKVVTKVDTTYNEEVIDETLSTDYEWGEYARNHLVWFIVDEFANNSRERAVKENNLASKP
jgi:hypothetical protein